jgi:multidrug efflux pump subunit AcrA (membrane-fusion protein)
MRTAYLIIIAFLIAGCKNSNVVHSQHKNIIETVYASGKIMADSEYTVYALNAGTIIKKLVKEGDVVKRGQVLYVINNTAPAARLEASEAAYDYARKNLSASSRILADLKLSLQNAAIKLSQDSLQYTRLRNLWAENIGTKNSLDIAESQYKTSVNLKRSAYQKYSSTVNDLRVALKNSQSQLAGAQNDLSNYIIRAESAGTVYQAIKESGEAVKPNEPVVLMGKSAERLIRLAVDQQDIDRVKAGQEVLLKTDLSGDKIYHAKIVRMYPVMNEADQTFRVDAIFEAGVTQSYIHSSVEANIIVQHKMNCLVVPRQVLLNGDSLQVKQDGKTKTVAVKIGIRTLDEVEILGGITDRTEIATPVQK